MQIRYPFALCLLLCACELRAQSLEWVATAGSDGQNTAQHLAIDSRGDVIAAGDWIGELYINPGPSSTGFANTDRGAYLYKLGPQREFRWIAKAQTISGGSPMAIDDEDNVFLGSAAFSSTTLLPPIGPSLGFFTHPWPAFLWKLSPAGATQWLRQFAISGYTSFTKLASRRDGSVIGVGRFNGTLELGETAGEHRLTSMGDNDIFIVAMDGNGHYLWSRQLSGTTGGGANAVEVLQDGTVAVAGHYSGTVMILDSAPPVSLTSAGGTDGFLILLAEDGSLLRVGRIGGTGDDAVLSLAVDPGGHLALAGSFSESADLDPGPAAVNCTSRGSSDAFFAVLDPDGALQWLRCLGDTRYDSGNAIAFGSGVIYVGGRFGGSVNFAAPIGSELRTSSGASDGFVLRVDRDGQFGSVVTFGGNSALEYSDIALDLAVDHGGALYVAGGYSGVTDFDPSPGGTYLLSSISWADGFIWKLRDGGALALAAGLGSGALPVGVTRPLSLTLASTVAIGLTDLGLDLSLPNGLLMAVDAAPSSSCGGSFAAVADRSRLVMHGGVLPANTECTITVDIMGGNTGTWRLRLPPDAVNNNEHVWPLATTSMDFVVSPGQAVLRNDTAMPTVSTPGQTVEFSFGVTAPAGAAAATGSIVLDDGEVSCTVVLPEAHCSLAFSRIGSHVLTARYSGDARYKPTTLTVLHEVVGLTDLAIGLDGIPAAWQGGTDVSFDVIVTNAGPDNANDATMQLSMSGTEAITWHCLSGCTASGKGGPDLAISLPAGDTAAIRIDAVIPSYPETPIGLAASIRAGASLRDDNADNNAVEREVRVVLFSADFDEFQKAGAVLH